ncbi:MULTISPECIES: nucleotidyl transferase AbiEii/AbiGii toxin family protein [Novosphingobium]|uniref:Nucleotidyl transferase AbiEii/AbiGii toxin family protein n=1 Tax=Novosphingobium guangzhouense TaxID=1850347 RepID=A0A2K2FYA8_9SPHN|nr:MULTISPECIES: nucleotidyl transferase AbiEii/AbiGii toxin family protein [Novosphingobium]PNU03785.1 hypothetical protein A8V01_22260 [Novosphingobium guangzhouense]
MVARRPSEWPVLFDIMIELLDRLRESTGIRPSWSFGGGTALMLQIDHRESHDIDVFIDDPQLLAYLNPETQEYALSRHPDSYETDGTRALKLAFESLGEIDFICCHPILDRSANRKDIRGQPVDLETPAEIIAKKVYFRGRNFQPRDMFDLAAVTESHGMDYVAAALRECGADRCEIALATIRQVNPKAVEAITSQLMYREHNRHLIALAHSISRSALEAALA